MKKREYSFAVYYYVDSTTGFIDYIGFDSHIDSQYNRNHQHLNWKPQIKFDEILQNNPDRWEYHIFKKFATLEEATQCEYDLINLYRPRFNFKHGGVGTKKFYQDFKYTVVKMGFQNGKQNYTIKNPDNKILISSIYKNDLDVLAEKLNNKEITEEDIFESKKFKYKISKGSFTIGGKRQYVILSKNYIPIKHCVNKDKLVPLVKGLNDGSLTEDDVRKMNLNPFKYTVVKNGKHGFRIYGRDNKTIKSSRDKDKLEKVANALNNNVISEEQVKSTRSVDKIFKIILGD